jgi:hypothetical protein
MNTTADIILLFLAILCVGLPATIMLGTFILGGLVLLWDEVEAIIYGSR